MVISVWRSGVCSSVLGNVVYDSVGKVTFMDSMGSLKRRVTVCLYGASSGAVTSIDPLDLAESGSIFITRPHLADYIPTAQERTARARDLFAAFGEGRLTVTLDRSEEHTSELQSLMRISYAVFCLKKNREKQTTLLLYHQQHTYIEVVNTD